MKTVRVLGNRKMGVFEVPDPEAKDDLVVVKIMASTICGSEHRAYERNSPVPVDGAIGHEGAGIVWAVDKAKHVKVGDRVSIFPFMYESCLHCVRCYLGEWQLCLNPRNKRVHMGTHSQYVLVPEFVCLPIPEDMPFETAALIDDCLGTPYRAIKRLNVTAGETVFITGAGPVGMSAVIICKYRNARVIVSETNAYRREQAKLNGADYVFDPLKDDVIAAVKGITGGVGADVGIDCAGVEPAQLQCLEAVKAAGRMAFLGLNPSTTINTWEQFILKEMNVIGSWACTPKEHLELVNLIQQGMPVQKIITDRYKIDDADEAFRKFFGGGDAIKIVLEPWA